MLFSLVLSYSLKTCQSIQQTPALCCECRVLLGSPLGQHICNSKGLKKIYVPDTEKQHIQKCVRILDAF